MHSRGFFVQKGENEEDHGYATDNLVHGYRRVRCHCGVE